MTARELLEMLQEMDEMELSLDVWIQYKDSSGIVIANAATEPSVTTWNTGEITVTICSENAIWKGGKA